MKKVIFSLAVVFLLGSCNNTTVSQDIMYLQKVYPTAVIYRIDECRYIVADSLKVYDIRLRSSGIIYSKVKIR